MLAKIKNFIKKHQADIILLIGVILISLLSFAMGYIMAKIEKKEPIRIENPKHEIRKDKKFEARSTKFETNSKFECSNDSNNKIFNIGKLGNWDLFRISKFDIRISL